MTELEKRAADLGPRMGALSPARRERVFAVYRAIVGRLSVSELAPGVLLVDENAERHDLTAEDLDRLQALIEVAERQDATERS